MAQRQRLVQQRSRSGIKRQTSKPEPSSNKHASSRSSIRMWLRLEKKTVNEKSNQPFEYNKASFWNKSRMNELGVGKNLQNKKLNFLFAGETMREEDRVH